MPKISPSSIITYNQCPKKYFFYSRGYPQILSPEAEFGKRIHEEIANYYKNIPKLISPSEVAFYAGKYLSDELIRDNFIRFEKERLKYFHPLPEAIEQSFERNVFHGVVDVIFKSKDKRVCIDWKSGYTVNRFEYQVQAAIYKYITQVDEVWFVNLRFNKITKFKDFDIDRIKEYISKFVSGVQSGRFERVIGEHCEKCEYRVVCKLKEEGFYECI